jgi:hypothetical protein
MSDKVFVLLPSLPGGPTCHPHHFPLAPKTGVKLRSRARDGGGLTKGRLSPRFWLTLASRAGRSEAAGAGAGDGGGGAGERRQGQLLLHDAVPRLRPQGKPTPLHPSPASISVSSLTSSC